MRVLPLSRQSVFFHMIRMLVAIPIACLIFGLAQGQGWGGGLTAGINMSQVDGDLQGGYQQPGLHFGGFANYELMDRLFLQPEILLNQKGAREVQIFIFSRFNVIDVPVSLQYLVVGEPDLGLYIHGGLSFGYLLSSSEGWPIKLETTGTWKKLDYGLVGGASVRVHEYLSIMLRKNYSLLRRTTGSIFYHRGFTLAVRVHLR